LDVEAVYLIARVRGRAHDRQLRADLTAMSDG
jgi:hypothetical protein